MVRPARPESSRPSTPVAPAALAALALLGGAYVVGVPLLARRRRQLRRDAARTPADRVLVAWAEAEEDLAAAGMAQRPSETAPEFAHRVARSAGPSGAGLVRLADDTSAAAWSSGGVAAEVATRAEAEAAGIARDLRDRSRLRDRARRALDPRPLLPRRLLPDRLRAIPPGGSAS